MLPPVLPLLLLLVFQVTFLMTDGQSTCRDRNSLCAKWASTGECYRNPSYMECNCPASCRTPALCGGQDSTCLCLSDAKKGKCLNETFRIKCPDTCRVATCNDTSSLSSLEPRVAAAEREVVSLKSLVLELQSLLIRQINSSRATPTTEATPTPTTSPAHSAAGGGASYVRWGRSSCPGEADLVYRGYAGGSLYAHTGGAANTLCLPESPQYANFSAAMDDNSAFLYGAEYETGSPARLPGFPPANSNVPCAVCRSPTRSSALMVPARTSCYPGFHLEYAGYLMAGRYTHKAASEFICVDREPQASGSGEANEEGKLLFFVEGYCGSLPCPPYSFAKEVTCVVCSK